MLPARAITDQWPSPVRTSPALLTRDECALWQTCAEQIALRRGQPGRMLELALAALQYASEGAAPAEALRLADDLLFGARGSPRPGRTQAVP